MILSKTLLLSLSTLLFLTTPSQAISLDSDESECLPPTPPPSPQPSGSDASDDDGAAGTPPPQLIKFY